MKARLSFLSHPGYHRRRTLRLVTEGHARSQREQLARAAAQLQQSLPRLVDPAELWSDDLDDAAGRAVHALPRPGVH